MAGMIVDDDIDFSLYEQQTDAQERVKPASVYVQELLDRIASGKREAQALMPWSKTHDLIQFRPGEVTVWGGPNGSGKSLVTGQVATGLCAQGERVCVASFEMKPAKTLERMARQWAKCSLSDPLVMGDPSERRIAIELHEQFRDWTDGKLWMYDRQGTVNARQVCAVARYCAANLGITHFIVDSLMKAVAGEDDFNGQKAFVDELTAIARDNAMHIHLVHHVRKPASEDALPTKYDFKGSGSITDQVDNVIAVWRNKRKERDRQSLKPVSASDPDVKLIVDKQRNGEGWEGHIGLWFHHPSHQFLPSFNAQPADLWSVSC